MRTESNTSIQLEDFIAKVHGYKKAEEMRKARSQEFSFEKGISALMGRVAGSEFVAAGSDWRYSELSNHVYAVFPEGVSVNFHVCLNVTPIYHGPSQEAISQVSQRIHAAYKEPNAFM